MFDSMRNHPLVRKALAAGEERFGRAVSQLLSSERVVNGLQSLVSSAFQARETFERGVRRTLAAVNLPTSDDVEDLKRRLVELESILDDLAAQVERTDGAATRGPAGPVNGR